eukprot:TRINITY_DN15109_c0_g1_i1.p1 TRINITY_DN15109_c0_g1~~TRINITY_DN15109_c0_g1_i1.p1  ORF type:complete len:383 (-),score=74.77 TRINITY_DN15109_c0_g1_i1:333-1481(-)
MLKKPLSDSRKSYRWIKAICEAKFDHEIGMLVERMAPVKALTETETNTVAMLSFPESNCSENEWEHTFFYRFRRDSNASSLESEATDEDRYLFGYVYYMQRKDSTQARGYQQRSFVIVTPFYFSCFYMNLVQLIGRTYFNSLKIGLLSELYESTLTWPLLHPGANCQFHVLAKELKATVPSDLYTYLPSLDTDHGKGAIDLKGLSIFQDVSLSQCWPGASSILLWHLWEIVVTETPLLIIADTPYEVSYGLVCLHRQMISSIISLVHPLKFMGDYRPYITMYDSDIKLYAALFKEKKRPLVVMGTCNPYLARMLENFPAVLHLEKEYYQENKLTPLNQRKMSEFMKNEKPESFVKKILKTKERMYLASNKELLQKLKDGVVL